MARKSNGHSSTVLVYSSENQVSVIPKSDYSSLTVVAMLTVAYMVPALREFLWLPTPAQLFSAVTLGLKIGKYAGAVIGFALFVSCYLF